MKPVQCWLLCAYWDTKIYVYVFAVFDPCLAAAATTADSVVAAEEEA